MDTKKVAKVLLNSSTLLFAISLTAGMTLEANKTMVNQFLHTKTSQTVSSGGGELWKTFTVDYDNTTDLVKAHAELGERAEAEGATLLKNASALPLDKAQGVTLFGLRSTKTYNAGNSSAAGGASVDASPSAKLASKGFKINPVVSKAYDDIAATTYYKPATGFMAKERPNGIKTSFTPVSKAWVAANGVANVREPKISELEAINSGFDTSFDGYSSAAIVILGRSWAEAGDYFEGAMGVDQTTGARNILSLNDDERALLTYAKSKCSKVIVLLQTTHPMEVQELQNDSGIGAIMWIGQAGGYGWEGIGDLLSGATSPSGHLVDTFASNTASSPSMRNFGVHNFSDPEKLTKSYMSQPTLAQTENTASDTFVVESEGIYVGYKYYETRYEDCVLGNGNAASTAGVYDSKSTWKYSEEVTYPFGYGLSYTSFSQKVTGLKLASDKKSATLSVEVTNTGKVAGKDAVQVYAQSPYTDYDKQNGVEKAAVNLLNYAKTDTLEAGAKTTVSIPLDFRYLASYDAVGKKTYIMDSGDYYFAIGNGAHEATNNILAKKGKGTSNGMDENGDVNAVATWHYDAANGVDDYSFSVSENSKKITNQFDDADWNNLTKNSAEKVTYLSRNDWSATWPKTYDGFTVTAEIAKYLNNDTYQIQSGDDTSSIKWDSTDSDIRFADMKLAAYDDERWDELLSKLNMQEAINFIVKGNRQYQELSTIGFASQTMTENGPTGLTVSLSEKSPEGAPWQVAKDDPYASYKTGDMCSADIVAATFNQGLAKEIGTLWGNDSLYDGIPVLWAPSLNLHRTAYNGRNGEYFSEDPIISGYTAAAESQGAQSKGLIVAVKHFAFNDQESCRDGIAMFMSEQKIRETELRGFQITFDGGVKALMTSYSRVGLTWNGSNINLMQNVLRGEWGFNGYAVSDMDVLVSYMSFKEGVIAGTTNYDMLGNAFMYCKDNYATETTNTFGGDATMQKAIKERLHETLWTFAQSNYMNSVDSTSHSVYVWNWWRVTYTALEITFGVFALAALGYYVFKSVKEQHQEVK